MEPRSLLASVVVHAAIAAGVAWILYQDSFGVRGGAGLSGATQTRYDVRLAPVVSRPRPARPTLPKASEGIPVEKTELAQELPTELKKPLLDSPEEIPPSAVERRSEGTSESAAPGRLGQGGTSDTPADQVGNAERTSARGLYLAKMHRRIQANLEPPGYLAYNQTATLRIVLLRSGQVSRIEIIKSSGDAALDRRAVQAVQKAQPFDPWETEQSIHVPVKFNAS